MMLDHRRRLIVGVVAAFAVLLIGGVIAASSGDGHGSPKAKAETARATPQTESLGAGAVGPWNPVAPSTTVPSDTPVQEQYDQAFQQGFTSPANKAVVAATESLRLPLPSVGGGWPALTPADTPEDWTREFIAGLLNVDFAHQSREDLGAWIVAQEAPDLMPGIPAEAQLPGLYATVMAPDVTGQPSPVPSEAQWQHYADAGVHWSVTNVQVQPDPQWRSIVAAGWQPEDLYGAVEDVSGVLQVSEDGSTTSRTFSLVIQLGSARWHHGYGTALASGWKET